VIHWLRSLFGDKKPVEVNDWKDEDVVVFLHKQSLKENATRPMKDMEVCYPCPNEEEDGRCVYRRCMLPAEELKKRTPK
jgi:hypothetical protein